MHLILAGRSKLGMGSDAPDLHDLLTRRAAAGDVRTVLANPGFDSKDNHRFAQLDLNVEPLIRASAGYRAAKKGKAFGQRARVETFISTMKRNLNDALRSPPTCRRKIKRLQKAIAHNVMILLRSSRVQTPPSRPLIFVTAPYSPSRHPVNLISELVSV